MATTYISIAEASTDELVARLVQLDAYLDDAQYSMGAAPYPMHDAISADDPDAEWNRAEDIEAELAARAA